MRKKVSLIVMVLAILLMANLSLNANAQPYEVTPAKESDDTKLQIQNLQASINDMRGAIRDVQKQIQKLKDEEKELQQEITKVQQGGEAPAPGPIGIAEDNGYTAAVTAPCATRGGTTGQTAAVTAANAGAVSEATNSAVAATSVLSGRTVAILIFPRSRFLTVPVRFLRQMILNTN